MTKNIIDTYVNERKSILATSCETGESTYTVTKALKQAGVMRTQKLSPQTKKEIVQEWEGGAEAKEIMLKHSISKSGLWNIVKVVKRSQISWERQKPLAEEVVLTSFPKIKGRDYGGGVNVYRNTSGILYYGKAPYQHKDKKVESGISADYAFDIVNRRNKK